MIIAHDCYCCDARFEFETLAEAVECECGAVYLIGGVADLYLADPSRYNNIVTPTMIQGELLDYRDAPGDRNEKQKWLTLYPISA